MNKNINPSNNSKSFIGTNGSGGKMPLQGNHSKDLGMMAGKAKNFKGTLKRLLKYLGAYKIGVFFVVLFTIISTAFNIVGPKILGGATTEIYRGLMGKMSGTGNGINFDVIYQIIINLLFLYIISFVFSYLQSFIMTGISMKMTYKLRDNIIKKINRMPLKYFDTVSNGEILSRVTNDVDMLSQSLNQSLTQVIMSITTILGIAIMMFSINWQMSLAVICIVPLSFLFITIVVKKSQKYFVDQQEYLGKLNGHIEEMYSGHNVMKAFNGEKESLEKFDVYNSFLYNSAWKSQFLSGLMVPIMSFISNLVYVAVCILGGYFVAHNVVPVGDVQAFLQYARQFNQPIMQISNISNILQQTIAAAERIFEFLEEEEELPDCTKPVCVLNTDCKSDQSKLVNIFGNVEFKNVKFGYNSKQPIIKNFSVKVNQGQKIAIVGSTGSGKTTIVKLLMRFYEIDKGAILIDDNNITEFTRDGLRSLFGMVLQDTWLYNASIKENIRYGNLAASDDDVINAAKAAQVDHFVRTLPEGYETILNEQTDNISLGQKQLLTIARAILSEPKILILDEATSSVDTETESLIQKAMDHLMKNKTSFIIAHRLSTIKNADLILVMDKGDIVEQGTHFDLLNQKGVYANMYNSQFEVG